MELALLFTDGKAQLTVFDWPVSEKLIVRAPLKITKKDLVYEQTCSIPNS
jgi:hypothetical protein